MQQHQGEAPIHRPPQRQLQAGARYPGSIAELQTPPLVGRSLAMAQEDQRIPARLLRQHRLQGPGACGLAPQQPQRVAAPPGQVLQGLHLRLQVELLLVAHHHQQPGPPRAHLGHRLRWIQGRQPPEGPIEGQGLPGQLLQGPQLRSQPQPQGQARLEPQGAMQGPPALMLKPLLQAADQLLAVVLQHGGG